MTADEFNQLRKGDLVVVHIAGIVHNARVADVGKRDDSPSRIMVEHLFEAGELIASFSYVVAAQVARKVELVEFRDVQHQWDVARHAAIWMGLAMSPTEALSEITYMLGGKLHKYLPEAWLGGCDLEVEASRV